MEKSIVVVTGGTGYIASWIIHDLLIEGHEVRITVRNKKQIDKYQHLLDIEKKSKGTLSVFEADLLKPGSFDEVVSGADYVMHTASPFSVDPKLDPKIGLLDPAVNGTINVLESVNKAPSVRRVILTSSVAAIYGDNKDLVDQGLKTLTEAQWNTTSSLDHGAYSYSKTQAEKKAWEMAGAQTRWDLVTIHPGFVFGPSLSKRVDSTSINTLLRLLKGEFKTGVPRLDYVFSDIRDIAQGHLAAMSIESAKGRYIVANEHGGLLDVANIIKISYGNQYKVPVNSVPKAIVWLVAPSIGLTREYIAKNVGYPIRCDNSRSINELKIAYHSLEETIVDHVDQLKKDGLI